MWAEVEMDIEEIYGRVPFATPKSGVNELHLHAALDGITSAVEDGGGASHVGRHCQFCGRPLSLWRDLSLSLFLSSPLLCPAMDLLSPVC